MSLENDLLEHLSKITPPNKVFAAGAQQKEDSLAKLVGSLGRLEEIAVKLSAIQNTSKLRHKNKLIVVCGADHGVVDENVSPCMVDVTWKQMLNFQAGGGAISVLARQVGAKLIVADIGVNHNFAENSGIVNYKIAYGTKNMAKEPAMTREEAIKSVLAGIELVLKEDYVDLVSAGEMGIGNTTPSSAICSVFMDLEAEATTGAGSGLDAERIKQKAKVIDKAITLHKPNKNDPLDVLAKIGGFEIGAMAGVYLGGAIKKSAVIIDGFIAGAAALLAAKLCPAVKDYFIAGHRSMEKAHGMVLEHLGLKPLLDLDMRLGEGSGAAIAMFIAQCAATHHNEMVSYAEMKNQ